MCRLICTFVRIWHVFAWRSSSYFHFLKPGGPDALEKVLIRYLTVYSLFAIIKDILGVVVFRSRQLNPSLPSGPVHPNRLEESIFNFSVSGVLFHFYFIFYRNSCKQTVQTLIRCRVLQRLILVCTVCLGAKNGTLSLYGLIGSKWENFFEKIIYWF